MLPGQPPKFKTAEELEAKINEYFDHCDNRIQQIYSAKAEGVIEVINPEPYTIEGLAYACGFESRQSIYDYEKRNKGFSYIIKKARLKIQNSWSVGAMEGKNAAGYIFQLKNNAGYTDKTEVDQTINTPTGIKIKFVDN